MRFINKKIIFFLLLSEIFFLQCKGEFISDFSKFSNNIYKNDFCEYLKNDDLNLVKKIISNEDLYRRISNEKFHYEKNIDLSKAFKISEKYLKIMFPDNNFDFNSIYLSCFSYHCEFKAYYCKFIEQNKRLKTTHIITILPNFYIYSHELLEK